MIQVAVSDSYFALDVDGRVHYAAVTRHEIDDYHDVTAWTNVKKIVMALQNGILGITAEGKVLCAGSSFTKGPHGNAQRKLSELNHVIDACVTGSEGEEVYIALEDSTVLEVFTGRVLRDFRAFASKENVKTLDSAFNYNIFCLDSNRRLRSLNSQLLYCSEVFSADQFVQGSELISSFAVKDGEIIAVSI